MKNICNYFNTSLLNSVGGMGSLGDVGSVGQILAWMARVAWVHKILAWVKKYGVGQNFSEGGVGGMDQKIGVD